MCSSDLGEVGHRWGDGHLVDTVRELGRDGHTEGPVVHPRNTRGVVTFRGSGHGDQIGRECRLGNRLVKGEDRKSVV